MQRENNSPDWLRCRNFNQPYVILHKVDLAGTAGETNLGDIYNIHIKHKHEITILPHTSLLRQMTSSSYQLPRNNVHERLCCFVVTVMGKHTFGNQRAKEFCSGYPILFWCSGSLHDIITGSLPLWSCSWSL